MSKTEKIDTGLTDQKILRRLFYGIGVLIALFAVLSYINFRTRYIEVKIALPNKNAWDYADRSIRVWTDDPKYYIWRSETRIYPQPFDGLDTKEAVIEHIDHQLLNNGWKYVYFEGLFPCDSILPESEFLEWGDTYRAYKQAGWVDYQRGTPTLCLAVWPIENYGGFHVVIMTANPSLLTRLQYLFD